MGYNFLGVLEIIKGSIKILPKNGKIMALIAALCLLFYSSTFLFYFFIYKPLRSSMDLKFALIALILILLYLYIFAFVARIINLSTIYVSAMSLNGQEVSFKELYRRVKKSFKGGSIFSQNPGSTNYKSRWPILLVISISTLLIIPSILYGVPIVFVISALVVILVPAVVYSIYISVTSVFAYVIYVVEDNCGMDEAMMKAGLLVKERKVDGFVLNLMLNSFILILVFVYVIITEKWPSYELITGIFFLCIASLQTMFVLVAYTYLYFKCKEEHGEEIMPGNMLDYIGASSLPLLDENVP